MEYYIDLGSSTIKVYEYLNNLRLVEEHTIYFKNNFDSNEGISAVNRQELIDYFTLLKSKYDMHYENTHIYVTGIFRNLNYARKCELVRLFNDTFDLHFNIISHGIEAYYLSKAMENDYNNNKVLIINMGGKTTELVTFENNKVSDIKKLNIGVADILNNFENINESKCEIKIEDIVKYVDKEIKNIKFDTDYDVAIFTGGEERFELLTGFNLIENTLFDDGIHKYMLTLEDYIEGTKKVFYKYTLEDLHKLMPENPLWMDGARAGAIIPLSLFYKTNVKYIIPSDLNLINGVINDNK
jgi:exopolyphosphatase/pppGpp-phosphohydrolase